VLLFKLYAFRLEDFVNITVPELSIKLCPYKEHILNGVSMVYRAVQYFEKHAAIVFGKQRFACVLLRKIILPRFHYAAGLHPEQL